MNNEAMASIYSELNKILREWEDNRTAHFYIRSYIRQAYCIMHNGQDIPTSDLNKRINDRWDFSNMLYAKTIPFGTFYAGIVMLKQVDIELESNENRVGFRVIETANA